MRAFVYVCGFVYACVYVGVAAGKYTDNLATKRAVERKFELLDQSFYPSHKRTNEPNGGASRKGTSVASVSGHDVHRCCFLPCGAAGKYGTDRQF